MRGFESDQFMQFDSDIFMGVYVDSLSELDDMDKLEKQIELSLRFSELIIMYQKAFLAAKIEITEGPADCNRGNYKLVSQEKFPVIVKKNKNPQVSLENFQIQSNELKRFAIKHQSLLPLLGWAQYEGSLYYVYKYYDTPIGHYLNTTEVDLPEFLSIAEKIIWGIIFLNSRQLFISSSTLYIQNEIPVFGEKIKNFQPILKQKLYRGESFFTCLELLISRYSIQNQHLIKIFENFETLNILNQESFNIIQNLKDLELNVLQSFTRNLNNICYSTVNENIKEFYLTSNYLLKVVEEHYLRPFFQDNPSHTN